MCVCGGGGGGGWGGSGVIDKIVSSNEAQLQNYLRFKKNANPIL